MDDYEKTAVFEYGAGSSRLLKLLKEKFGPDVTPSVLFARLSWRPALITDSMISLPDEPIRPTILPRTLTSPLGLLDALPTELQRLILNSADFQTLVRFARVCHQAKTMVDSLLSYQDMMKHAPTTLMALSQSKLITVHAAGTIHAALHSDKCVFCQKFGPFLFLPTCQRCCYECLRRERFLRVVPARMAGDCFGVSRKDLRQIPMMLGIPGQYAWCRTITSQTKCGYFSVKQAEELGISIHGSREAMESFVSKSRKVRNHERLLVRWLSGTTPDSEPQLSSTFAMDFNAPRDNFSGTASVNFPSLRPDGELEDGLWCYGCRDAFVRHCNYWPNGKSKFDRDSSISLAESTRILSGMSCEARSRSGFLEHLKDCEEATNLFQKLENPGWT